MVKSASVIEDAEAADDNTDFWWKKEGKWNIEGGGRGGKAKGEGERGRSRSKRQSGDISSGYRRPRSYGKESMQWVSKYSMEYSV